MQPNHAIDFERQRQRFYRSAKASIRRALKQCRSDFDKALQNCDSVTRMKDLARQQLREQPLRDAVKNIYATTGKHFGTAAYERLKPPRKRLANPGQQIREDYWFAWADKEIRNQSKLGQHITWMTETTRETIMNAVERATMRGVDEGWGIDKIKKEVMKELDMTEAYRAERIARTEVIGASNASTHAGAQATGVDFDKEWIAYIDDRTRDSHAALNGSVVDMNEAFDNGLMFPGDPSGDAEEIINCRCTQGYIAKSDSEFEWGRNLDN